MPTLSELPAIQSLPDPFEWADGRGRISHYSDWEYRRNEIGDQIQNYEIGERPSRPDTITASYSNSTLTVNVTMNGKTLTLTSQVILPAGSGPFPVVIGMDSPYGSIPVLRSLPVAILQKSHSPPVRYRLMATRKIRIPTTSFTPILIL